MVVPRELTLSARRGRSQATARDVRETRTRRMVAFSTVINPTSLFLGSRSGTGTATLHR
ncbi:hypothetical protein GCM10010254_62840 [Streptomyces chromofuscus]|nr:hypothetical protein GCM10010254_62840 [Streptomyces chromofuscus]